MRLKEELAADDDLMKKTMESNEKSEENLA